MVGQHAADPADGLTWVFGGVKGADVFFSPLDEVVGEFAVEVLVGVGLEVQGALTAGAARERLGAVFAFFQDLVEQHAVMAGDVLHIGHVFVSALDLEAAHARVDDLAQVVALVVVLHRQDVFVVRDDAALGVFDLVRQTAGLRAVATVGAAPRVGMADETLAAVGHTQRAVHKKLHHRTTRRVVGAQGAVDGGDLWQRELARQDDL